MLCQKGKNGFKGKMIYPKSSYNIYMTPEKARELLLKRKKQLKRNLVKDVADKILALALVLILSPIILLIVIALIIEKLIIKDVERNVFYREKRVSLGKDFYLLKFRTIRKSVLQRERQQGHKAIKGLEQDPQSITPVGKIIHKIYLDEIPQLFDVIKGDMSMVGPRPLEKTDYLTVLKKGETCKSLIKPGLTGLVQIHKGTKKASFLSDYEYIYKYMTYGKFRLLLFDLKILLQTVIKVLKAEGY